MINLLNPVEKQLTIKDWGGLIHLSGASVWNLKEVQTLTSAVNKLTAFPG